MKLKIKVLEKTAGCMPEIIEKGDWIDLRVAKDTKIPRGKITYVPLGVAMRLPDGFEAVVIPRSSTAKKHRVLQGNSVGLIDGCYHGDGDEWMFPAYPIGHDVALSKGDRICQFRIQPSQKASVWQKVKWMLSSGVKLEKTDHLENENRSGFGSTGV